jgi:hypothetical protein
MASLQNFIHKYSHIYDPATIPQEKEHSVLIADRLDSTDEQTCLYRCLESSMVIQTINILPLIQLSQIISQFDEDICRVETQEFCYIPSNDNDVKEFIKEYRL